ncbi:MAG: diacylglycerol kinase [Gammaproteobacteria bacterium]|nr:diacylglycerol kinase family protein [Rhodoferax sp.]MBU3899653.1 diacylglycerol kinase [Gammaproteobacteria bacterium]MBA3057214.1 diacylglycerol kinase [Rhodoferax sp.]MBU3997425.1 diacylglycerol kinase [Gammaproteobacteria bacterium]MBU4018129.1 diacylglycerol kinase [Gammaproteobacteria bacterium]MBU4080180.1 diacylglycerol kinase [Gammaproteobacteria bacterium]
MSEVDRSAPLLFVINAAAGHQDLEATRELIESALRASSRVGELLIGRPQDLAQVAQKAAANALSRGGAVVAVGGDGTINTVAQAAYAQGCAMGVLPQGTFNYFARTHGIPGDAAQALQVLLSCEPEPVQVGLINERVFLVNASLGLYPELLQDREAWKARFGRSRVVAFAAALATLLGRRRQLRLRIEHGTEVRNVTTPTLFIGNNRLQLEQVGLAQAEALDQGSLAAVMLRPIGALAMLWLLLRGSFGQLGEADSVQSVHFQRMLVTPRLRWVRRRVKVAFDGEVSAMRAPIEFRVAPKPLYLIKPASANGATGQAGGGA